MLPTWVSSVSGQQTLYASPGKMTFNPSTGTLSTTGLVISTNRGQFTGNGSPATGTGVEVGSSGTTGIINSYNRSSPAYVDLAIYGKTLSLYPKTADGTGTLTADLYGAMKFMGSTSGYTQLQAAATAGSASFTLPSTDGTNGQFLKTNGSGVLSFATPEGGGGGQVVSARLITTLDIGLVAMPSDNTIPQSNEGTQVFAATITPTTSTSKLVIQFMGQFGAQDGDILTAALFKDNQANALCAMPTSYFSDTVTQTNLIYTMTSGTLDDITFKVRVGPRTAVGANRLLLNQSTYGGVTGTFLIITETL
jgi:hypothetical protein